MQQHKYKKPRTIQMSYPAPYSKSWTKPEPVQKEAGKINNSASFPANRKKQAQAICNWCWQRPKPLTHGCNPYAPHLKYGLFPRKVTLREPANKQSMSKNGFPLDSMNKVFKDRKRFYKKERSNTPLIVITPIDKQDSRQLSLSKITHVDIQPRSCSTPFPQLLSPTKPPPYSYRMKAAKLY